MIKQSQMGGGQFKSAEEVTLSGFSNNNHLDYINGKLSLFRSGGTWIGLL
jgi:hypothetical protein